MEATTSTKSRERSAKNTELMDGKHQTQSHVSFQFFQMSYAVCYK